MKNKLNPGKDVINCPKLLNRETKMIKKVNIEKEPEFQEFLKKFGAMYPMDLEMFELTYSSPKQLEALKKERLETQKKLFWQYKNKKNQAISRAKRKTLDFFVNVLKNNSFFDKSEYHQNEDMLLIRLKNTTQDRILLDDLEKDRHSSTSNPDEQGKPNNQKSQRINSELNTDLNSLAHEIKSALTKLSLRDTSLEAGVAAILKKEFEAASKDNLYTKLPALGEIPLYKKRKNKSMDAIEFYNTHWRIYSVAGLLSQTELNDFDRGLIPAIRQLCRNRKISPDSILPPKQSELVAQEIQRRGLTEEELNRYYNHMRRHGFPKEPY